MPKDRLLLITRLNGRYNMSGSKSNIMAIKLVFFLMLPISLWSHDDLDLQIDRLTIQIQENPANPNNYLLRGNLYLRQEKWKKSIRDFEQFKKKGGESTTACYKLAVSWYHLDEYNHAIQYANNALDQAPDHAQVWWIKGKLFEATQDMSKAITCYKKAIECSDRKIPDHFLYIVDRLVFMGSQDDLQQALNILVSGIDHLGPLVVFIQKQVDLLMLLNRYETAIEVQNHLVLNLPRKERAYLRRAELFLLSKNYAKALADAQQVQQLIAQLPQKFRYLPTTQNLLKETHTIIDKCSTND